MADKSQTRVLRGGNIQRGTYSFLDNDIFIKDELVSPNIYLRKNDLITPAVTSLENIGKIARITEDYDKVTVGGFVFILRGFYNNDVLAKYLYYAIQSDYFTEKLKYITKASGSAFFNINKERFLQLILPIPTENEQSKIVSFLDEVFAYIDFIEQNQSDYGILVESLNKAVLQSAIQGKLVEQEETDEPATILLERIREEKRKQLGKKYVESYIYKGDDNRYYEKNGSETQEITEEIPFDIPHSWEWCRAYNCLLPMESKKPQGISFPYIDIDAIDNKKQIVKMPKILETSKAPSRASRKVHAGDTLFSMVRPYLKNIAFIDESLKECIASTGFYVCQPDKMLYPRYLFLMLISPYFINGVMEFMKGDNSPSIRTENLENMLLPIPPLREQERIVNVYNSIILSIKDEG